MEILERIWESLGGIGNAILSRFERGITAMFGSANARFLKKLQPRVDAINALEPKLKDLSNEQLSAKTDEFRERLGAGETVDDLLVEAFAVCREAGRRFLSMRHYDVQLIGGMILHEGNIAEMVTGEGKTLVATLPAYLNAVEGKGVHVVTVNDYLARRDMEWMAPLYQGLGLTVDAIWSGMEPDERQGAYACDITYGTNNEFGFDLYLHLKNQRLSCINLTNGQEQWRSKPFGKYWSMVAQGDKILALDERGLLRLLRANPDQFELLDEREVTDSPTWAHLAVSGNDVIVRALDSLVAYRWQ